MQILYTITIYQKLNLSTSQQYSNFIILFATMNCQLCAYTKLKLSPVAKNNCLVCPSSWV
jgi:hypothetical protein